MVEGIKSGNVVLGSGRPKICVPLVGRDEAGIKEEIGIIKECRCDLVEWRIDYFSKWKDHAAAQAILKLIKNELGKPVISTFRTSREGGESDISGTEYTELYTGLLESGPVDILDIELSSGDDIVKNLTAKAHNHNSLVISSFHDFNKTPPFDALWDKFQKMDETGADILKIAVMPKKPADVIELLRFTESYHSKYPEKPMITMSMGKDGVISRISGALTGSCLTFAAAKKASAPGQLSVDDVFYILEKCGS